MRKLINMDLEVHRVLSGPMASTADNGNNGFFMIPFRNNLLRVMSSDSSTWHLSGLTGTPWEHVSVSLKNRCPNWDEMCFIKDLFWNEDELVIQYHMPKKYNINCHPYCLHMWKPLGIEIPTPPPQTVGPVS